MNNTLWWYSLDLVVLVCRRESCAIDLRVSKSVERHIHVGARECELAFKICPIAGRLALLAAVASAGSNGRRRKCLHRLLLPSDLLLMFCSTSDACGCQHRREGHPGTDGYSSSAERKRSCPSSNHTVHFGETVLAFTSCWAMPVGPCLLDSKIWFLLR